MTSRKQVQRRSNDSNPPRRLLGIYSDPQTCKRPLGLSGLLPTSNIWLPAVDTLRNCYMTPHQQCGLPLNRWAISSYQTHPGSSIDSVFVSPHNSIQ